MEKKTSPLCTGGSKIKERQSYRSLYLYRTKTGIARERLSMSKNTSINTHLQSNSVAVLALWFLLVPSPFFVPCWPLSVPVEVSRVALQLRRSLLVGPWWSRPCAVDQ
jgi:hypothetical protein